MLCRLSSVSKINVTIFLCLVRISLPTIFPNQNFVCLSCFPSVWCSAKLVNPENSYFSFVDPVSLWIVCCTFFLRHRCILHVHPIVTIKGVSGVWNLIHALQLMTNSRHLWAPLIRVPLLSAVGNRLTRGHNTKKKNTECNDLFINKS